jgi:hypothetical protein
MGQVDRTTGNSGSNPIGNPTIVDVQGRMVAGQKITSADINIIRDAVVGWNLHTHDYYDQVTLNDFGNVNGGSSSQNLTSGQGPGTASSVASGVITAAVVNEYNTAAAALKNHSHTHSAS